ncbi:MAG: hypothetical protein K2Y37_23865 [Pirellulales bacterium]|nr:hypothetical protein [Pirellulales bacterium]
MLIRLTTELDAPADVVWQALKRVDTFRFVTRGLMGVAPEGRWPAEFHVGDVLVGRVWLAHVVPAWMHQIQLVRLDDARREIFSRENGGLLRDCTHRLVIEPCDASRCRYTDEFDVRAGRLTSIAAAIVWAFFHYRQFRWRRLAQTLAKKASN